MRCVFLTPFFRRCKPFRLWPQFITCWMRLCWGALAQVRDVQRAAGVLRPGTGPLPRRHYFGARLGLSTEVRRSSECRRGCPGPAPRLLGISGRLANWSWTCAGGLGAGSTTGGSRRPGDGRRKRRWFAVDVRRAGPPAIDEGVKGRWFAVGGAFRNSGHGRVRPRRARGLCPARRP